MLGIITPCGGEESSIHEINSLLYCTPLANFLCMASPMAATPEGNGDGTFVSSCLLVSRLSAENILLAITVYNH